MAKPISLALVLCFTAILPFWTIIARSESIDFLYHGFNGTNLVLEEAVIEANGALRLTNTSHNAIGHAFYSKPIPMVNSATISAANISSFCTSFVFQILPAGNNEGGYGLAFTLSPSPQFVGSQGEHFLGVLNSSNDRSASNHIFMVEFDTVNGYQENSDKDGNHVGININSMNSVASEPASYYKNGTSAKEEVDLESGEPIQVWIDYDGLNKVLNVTIAPSTIPKPGRPLMSEFTDLSPVMNQLMYAGFSAATGRKTSSHYILGWSFRLNGAADSLDLSRLPIIPPAERKSSSFNPRVKKALIATISVVVLLLLIASISVSIYRFRMQFEPLEDWELDCPRRFRYKDLYAATRGFKDSELIGVGGFGAVYRGVLHGTGAEVAVKKISKNSVQGPREFAAEIETLGRLRHKHLVNLQGWCKYKNDLLLVYDYVPNGSLDCFIYCPENEMVLTWEERFRILKGIAAGLLYLHEEWEQVVIHRDVKSSNVLIDGDMNGRLGDFGLARLYERCKYSYTTNVVGTIGYIAPELTRTGKASTSSDVYAYGVLLLEVASGRAPIVIDQERGPMVLVDWVIECLQSGKILDAIDPKLNYPIYDIEEIEFVLKLGLLCTHSKPEARPTMRQIMLYLNGDDFLSSVNSALGCPGTFENTSGSLQAMMSSDAIPASRGSSSIGEISTSSFDSGR